MKTRVLHFASWFIENWFLLLCLSLITFIVFFPKLPLLEALPGYIVRIRFEDFLIGIAHFAFAIQLLRRKATLDTPLTAILVFYAVVGFLSMYSALYWVNTMPLNSKVHAPKMFLHYMRRLEYFSLFFLFFNAVKSHRHLRMVGATLMIIVIGISVYGFGQKYWRFPVYSTMNREFSKGMRLELTEFARVPSTFGGHYDMSAFMVLALSIILSFALLTPHRNERIWLSLVFVVGLWLLNLGASRSSFLAFLISIATVVALCGVYKKSIRWTITRGFLVLAVTTLLVLLFGDLSSRFYQLGVVKQIQGSIYKILRINREIPPVGTPVDKTDQLPAPVEDAQSLLPTFSIIPTAYAATPSATPRILPPDVYKDIPDIKTIISTESGVPVKKVIEVPREFSPCTYKYGLSACIRFDTLWPRALNGFFRNPILGSGYSTLTKEKRDEFTEAESTDNDFLRNLGETGVLGVIGFYGPIAIFFIMAIKTLPKTDSLLVTALLFGLMAGTMGLFFNALYIDVFEASKVAFVYWAFMGVGFAAIRIVNEDAKRTGKMKKNK